VNRDGTTKARIAKCALRMLEAEGPESVSMRRVAGEVGITPMAIYHYFPTRQSLLRTIVDREFDQFAEAIHSVRRPRSFMAQMIHIMDAYVDYAFARPRIFDYVFSNPRPHARRFPEDFRARRSPTLTPIADAVAYWMKQGRLANDDAWEIAMEIWAHVHGYLMLYRAGRFGLSEEEFKKLVHRSLRRLLNGLKA
jgi:AcrR family transcriptional regulator